MSEHELIFKGAIIDRITTSKDGGWKITFDILDRDLQMINLLNQLRERTLTIPIVVEEDVRGAW